jgi:diaminopimelate decarboxylase
MDRNGELVAFMSTGAYGAATSSGYNNSPLTPEVLVDRDRWALVRRRIDFAACAAMLLPRWPA